MDPTKFARRARQLYRLGRITRAQLILADTLVWSCRASRSNRARVSYTKLCRLARCARSTIAAGLRALEGAGLLTRHKQRLRVAWAGGLASRQDVTIYELHSTGFDQRTVDREAREERGIEVVRWRRQGVCQPPRMTPTEQIAWCLANA